VEEVPPGYWSPRWKLAVVDVNGALLLLARSSPTYRS
jgi:hypothetical protein